jgi:hypothetical protein
MGPPAHDATKEKKKDTRPADNQEEEPKKPFKWTPLKIIGLIVIALILIGLGTIYYIYAGHPMRPGILRRS